jgi:hypothetical protein
MCNHYQEWRAICMNPGNAFESAIENVRYSQEFDDIPRNIGLIPRNTTNPWNELQKTIAECVVFCTRSQESDSFSLIPGNEFPAF